jgi:hypothetical protein
MHRFILKPEDLTTIGLFATGLIDRQEARKRLILSGGWDGDADDALDCVDFAGITVEKVAT